MAVANFWFKQPVNHTYSKGKIASYTDHILIPSFIIDNVLNCEILNNYHDNVSYHFALKLKLLVEAPVTGESQKLTNGYGAPSSYPRGCWDNKEFWKLYS